MVCTERGRFAIWVHVQEPEPHFEFQREWLPEVQCPIVDFSIARNQEQLAIAFSNHSIATVSLTHILPQSRDELEL